jgi:HK97 family phage major capsid protein
MTEKLPALGSTGDVLLADFSYYIVADRQATTIQASEHYAFTSDLTTWRFVHRVDGQPWLDEPIYIDTSNTVSPFVALSSTTTS